MPWRSSERVRARARSGALCVLLLALAGCPPPAAPAKMPTDLGSNVTETEVERRQRLLGELQDDVLSSYDRDAVPDTDA